MRRCAAQVAGGYEPTPAELLLQTEVPGLRVRRLQVVSERQEHSSVDESRIRAPIKWEWICRPFPRIVHGTVSINRIPRPWRNARSVENHLQVHDVVREAVARAQ